MVSADGEFHFRSLGSLIGGGQRDRGDAADESTSREFSVAHSVQHTAELTGGGGARLRGMTGDLRYAARTLLRSPRFTAMAVLVLALGMGAASAVFAVVYAVLLRPLPYKDPANIAVILSASEKSGGRMPVTPGDYQDFREQNRSFEEVAAASVWSPTLTGFDRAEKLDGLRVTAALFRVLGVQAAHGRVFMPEDEAPDAADAAVLTDGLFERRFGGDPSVVGRTITLDGRKHTVVGVMPRGFYFPPFWAMNADIFAIGRYRAGENGERGPGFLRLFGRLKPGVTFEGAEAEIRTIAARLAATYRRNAGVTATVTPIHEMSVGSVRPALLVLFGAVACTLLIGCANVSSLLIARAGSRRKEMAIRRSLGAERVHVVRQSLAESLLLVAGGSAASLALVLWAVPAFASAVPEFGSLRMPRRTEIGAGGMALLFHAAISLVMAVVCGIVSALNSMRGDVAADLKESGRGSVALRPGARTRRILAAAEIAVALLLLTGAGLLVQSYRNLRGVDPGFNPEGVVAVNVGLAASEYAPAERRAQFYQKALAELRALPGVAAASAVNHVPLAGDRFGINVTIHGRPEPPPGNTPNAVWRVAMPGYFSTMGIRLMEGRDFSERDDRDGPGVAIVNASMARRYWPGESAVGKQIRRGTFESATPWLSVIGVVADVKQGAWQAPADDEIYVPFLQDPEYRDNPAAFLTLTLVARGRGAGPAGPAIRDRIAAIDRNISVPNVFVMEQVARDVTWQPRAAMAVMLFFGVFAAVLAAVGIYAVMSSMVAARTQEIGVRMALGAQRWNVFGLVLGDAAAPVAAGIGLGLTAAAALTRLMEAMLFGVAPLDLGVFAAGAAGIAAVAAAACLGPALRAAGLDPVRALRAG